MKIRQDFVTNSSSVSYIITFCPDVYNDAYGFYWRGREEENKIKFARIEKLIIKDLMETGKEMCIEDCDLYVKRYLFLDEETLTDSWLEKQNTKLDFGAISDDELWDYIRGQFLMEGELGRIPGFGVTKVF